MPVSNLLPPVLLLEVPVVLLTVENVEFFQKNNYGLVAFITTGTPVCHIAVAEVPEKIKT